MKNEKLEKQASSEIAQSREAKFDAIRMIYELTELVWYDMGENSLQRKRIEAMREHIRETYDKSVYD